MSNDVDERLPIDSEETPASGTPAPAGEAMVNEEAAGATEPATGVAAAATSAAEVPLTPPELEALQAKAAKSDEHWDRLLRVKADFDNFKKRAARERQEAVRFANEALLEKLIPTLDNFDAALTAANGPAGASVESLKAGITMIQAQLKTALQDAGLEGIDATGQVFDPKWHEAVSGQDSADHPEGTVLQQVRNGYKLKERLIRPASVVVARKPAG